MDGATIITILVVYLISFGLVITDYITGSLGLYRIAAKRGVSNSWLAWIPFGYDWILGSVVDEYESAKGSKRKFRVILLVLGIVVSILYAITCVVIIGFMFWIAESLAYVEAGVVVAAVIYYLIVMPVFIMMMLYSVLNCLCLYKTHEYIYPEKSVKYLVLSLFVPLGRGICLLRNSYRCEEKAKTIYFPTNTEE